MILFIVQIKHSSRCLTTVTNCRKLITFWPPAPVIKYKYNDEAHDFKITYYYLTQIVYKFIVFFKHLSAILCIEIVVCNLNNKKENIKP